MNNETKTAVKRIPVGKYWTTVDAEDFERLSLFRWYASKHGSVVYAVTRNKAGQKPKFLKMHRLVLGLIGDDKRLADHKDGDGLNNRRSNLRIVTHLENNHNRPRDRRNWSGFKGVYFNPRDNKWRAQITNSGKRIHLGQFFDLGDAAKAYAEALKQYHGEFGRTS